MSGPGAPNNGLLSMASATFGQDPEFLASHSAARDFFGYESPKTGTIRAGPHSEARVAYGAMWDALAEMPALTQSHKGVFLPIAMIHQYPGATSRRHAESGPLSEGRRTADMHHSTRRDVRGLRSPALGDGGAAGESWKRANQEPLRSSKTSTDGAQKPIVGGLSPAACSHLQRRRILHPIVLPLNATYSEVERASGPTCRGLHGGR